MSIQDDMDVEIQAEAFMAKSPEQRERLLYVAILKTDRIVQEININGCKRQCNTGMMAIVDRWTPAAIGTAIMTVVVGLLEYLRGK